MRVVEASAGGVPGAGVRIWRTPWQRHWVLGLCVLGGALSLQRVVQTVRTPHLIRVCMQQAVR